MQKCKKNIVFFDLDGTLTKKDTFWGFVIYDQGFFKVLFSFIIFIPFIIEYILQIKNKGSIKESIFAYYFRGRDVQSLHAAGEKYSLNRLPGLLRPDAKRKLEWHLKNRHTVCIVTASSDIWVEKWCKVNNIDLIATKYDVAESRYTGSYLGKNCIGKEKVLQINAKYNLNEYERIYAYGNSRNDLDMLNLAHYKFYKTFKTDFDNYLML